MRRTLCIGCVLQKHLNVRVKTVVTKFDTLLTSLVEFIAVGLGCLRRKVVFGLLFFFSCNSQLFEIMCTDICAGRGPRVGLGDKNYVN